MRINKAEKAVRQLLTESGFKVDSAKDERANGVDIVAIKDGQALLIEVKKAKFHSRAWQVDPVSVKQQVVCNTIAIVTPSGIIIQPMKDHLKLCAKNGLRYITETIRLQGLFG